VPSVEMYHPLLAVYHSLSAVSALYPPHHTRTSLEFKDFCVASGTHVDG